MMYIIMCIILSIFSTTYFSHHCVFIPSTWQLGVCFVLSYIFEDSFVGEGCGNTWCSDEEDVSRFVLI